jgi:Mce-associated membrane protein
VIIYVQLDASSESRCACAGDSPGPVTDSDADPATTEAPASLAEAEDELSRAEARAEAARARAEAARARAAELRRQAEDGAGEAKPSTAKSHWSSRLPRPTRKSVSVGTAIVLIAASLGASGYFAWQHYALMREQRHAAEFAAAARQGVATMMSLDADHATESMQRTIDVTTGALKSQLESTSSYVAKNAQDAKVTTKATVQDVAVESMTDNSAVVLVVAKSDTINPDKSKRPPVFWRLSVNIDRDGGQLKLSKLDFVQ